MAERLKDAVGPTPSMCSIALSKASPNADLSQVNFGVITATISNYATGRGTPQEFQLSAKVSF